MDVMQLRRNLMMGKGKSKNLFNINAPFQNPSDTGSGNARKRIFTPYTHCYGCSGNNYWNTNNISYNVANDTLTVSAVTAYGVDFALPLPPGKYRISADNATYQRVNIGFYKSDGTWISALNSVIYAPANSNNPFVVPENCAITLIVFAVSTNYETTTYKKIQVEAGDTITPYEPF